MRPFRLAPAALALLAPLLLAAACGDLPQPFRGRPGAMGAQLIAPPAVRIAVPRPTQALLASDSAELLAEALAEALQAAEIPAAATEPLPLDWRLTIEAQRGEGANARAVVPRFSLTDADGTALGTVTGEPVPMRAWANGEAEALRAAARQAAPGIAEIVVRVEAARKATEPSALVAGPPRLRLMPVRGAPGDGNAALTARMRDFLSNRGFLVQDQAERAEYGVEGVVEIAQGATPAVQRVEVQWIVTRRDGQELGRVVQLNEVPAGSLNGLWGDVAYVVAQQAAGGVRDVIRNAIGGPPGSTPSEPPGGTPPGAAAPGAGVPEAQQPPAPAAETPPVAAAAGAAVTAAADGSQAPSPMPAPARRRR
ncbi:MAG: hypothetical protein IRZ13_12295 [Acetobacteraceae bacterium]|nr:hypothetical protein [Acetobacteraceae bacterium]